MKRTLTVAAVAVSVVLAGCAVAPSDEPSAPARAAVATTPPQKWPELPRGVLATGTFEGGAQGHVEIRNLGDEMLTLHIDGFRIDFDHYSGISALPYRTYPAEECGGRSPLVEFGYEQLGAVPERYESAVPLYGFSGDPSLIRELIIRDLDAPNWTDECMAAPAAKAVLDWTYEPLRASLVAVDSGATGGARGETTTVGDVIVSYTVVPNDLIDEVAARFGITADDIRYLNPLRPPKLRVGETIVLNGEYR